MTAQEVIQYIRDRDRDGCPVNDDCEAILDEYANQPKWIKVSERLPTKEDANEYGQVIICYSYMSMVGINYQLVGRTPLHKAWMKLEPFKE